MRPPGFFTESWKCRIAQRSTCEVDSGSAPLSRMWLSLILSFGSISRVCEGLVRGRCTSSQRWEKVNCPIVCRNGWIVTSFRYLGLTRRTKLSIPASRAKPDASRLFCDYSRCHEIRPNRANRGTLEPIRCECSRLKRLMPYTFTLIRSFSRANASLIVCP